MLLMKSSYTRSNSSLAVVPEGDCLMMASICTQILENRVEQFCHCYVCNSRQRGPIHIILFKTRAQVGKTNSLEITLIDFPAPSYKDNQIKLLYLNVPF